MKKKKKDAVGKFRYVRNPFVTQLAKHFGKVDLSLIRNELIYKLTLI